MSVQILACEVNNCSEIQYDSQLHTHAVAESISPAAWNEVERFSMNV